MFDYRLKFIRERKGVKQVEIAKSLGINKSTYSNYENERNIMPLKHLVKFCDQFDVSLDYLFGFNKLMNYKNAKNGIDKITFGKNLKKLRENLNISQEVLARTMKDHRTNISGYEIGSQLVSTKFLYSICKKYKISADFLLGRIDTNVNKV